MTRVGILELCPAWRSFTLPSRPGSFCIAESGEYILALEDPRKARQILGLNIKHHPRNHGLVGDFHMLGPLGGVSY